jgi:hypothetical protein
MNRSTASYQTVMNTARATTFASYPRPLESYR